MRGEDNQNLSIIFEVNIRDDDFIIDKYALNYYIHKHTGVKQIRVDSLNDQGVPFKEIARLIRETYLPETLVNA